MTIITSIRAAMRLLFLTGQNTSTRSGVSSIFGPTLNADIASKPRQLCVPMPIRQMTLKRWKLFSHHC